MKTIFIFILTVALILIEATTCQSQSIAKTLNSLSSGTTGNLSLSTPSTVKLNDICPGCQKNWTSDSYCLQWEVSTTKSSQNFKVEFANPPNASAYNLDWEWMYQDENNGQWKSFNNAKFPTSAYNHTNNIFTVYSSSFQCIEVIKFRVCIKGLQTQCTQNSGTVNLGFNVRVRCD
jgi:hypothetical protein